MTVIELINELKSFPEDREVIIETVDGSYTHIERVHGGTLITNHNQCDEECELVSVITCKK